MSYAGIIAGFLLLTLSVTSTSAQTAPESAAVVESGGYKLFIKVQHGTKPGLPTIVLESGGGFDSAQWSELQPALAAATGATVVSYDRPGFGKSTLPSKPYDIAEESRAFHSALENLGLAKSVLLIGHSYGGFLLQLYASAWPTTVQGLLFLDPNTPSFMLAAGAELAPKPMANPVNPRDRAFARIDSAGNMPFATVYQAQLPFDVPIIVVSAETPPFKTPRVIRAFQLSHELLAASVEDGKVIKADKSNHLIPRQRPDIVISSVQELLSKARK
jgi:pimeloyl-ACP methyl ester carboxylesterase